MTTIDPANKGKAVVSNAGVKAAKIRIPEPEKLFDDFLSRDAGKFKENPGGSSSLLFHHAALIKLDLEYCERANTHPELNLAPLYGVGEDQDVIRTKSGGSIKNDVFHSAHAVMYPPAVVCLLICYNRYHNYLVGVLSKINEGKRFQKPGQTSFDDEALFRTAQKIVIRIYRNITVADWLPSLAAANGVDSFDPITDIGAYTVADLPPEGRVSQLYSLETTISLADEAWYQEFLEKQLLANEVKKAKGSSAREKISNVSSKDYQKAVESYEKSIKSPDWRGFNGWKRKMAFLGKTWTYDNKNLADVLKSAIEQPAGAFTWNNIPKILRAPTTARIEAARAKKIPKLPDFHKLYKYKPLNAMCDINKADSWLAADLYNAYSYVNDVDIFPGLLLEDPQVTLDVPSAGKITVTPLYHFLATYTIKLAQKGSDEFTPEKLTTWGYNESDPDPTVFNGGICYKLIQRALPNWFPYNSFYIMQPMFSVAHNISQTTSDKTIRLYNTSYDHRDVDKDGNRLKHGAPSDPGAKQAFPPVVLHGWVKTVLSDQEHFHVPWAQKFNAMQPGIQTFDNYMLAGDKRTNYDQKKEISTEMAPPARQKPSPSDIFQKFLVEKATELINQYSDKNGSKMEIDIIRDVAIPTQTYFLADLFALNVQCDWNKEGELDVMELYAALLTVRIWGFTDFDFTKSWKRRNNAGSGVALVQQTTVKVVENILAGRLPTPEPDSVREMGTNMVNSLAKRGWKSDAIADVLWLTAVGSIGVVAGAIADSLNYILPKKGHWDEIVKAANSATNDNKAERNNMKIRQYFLESIRMSSSQGLARNVVKDKWVVAWALPPYLPIPIPIKYKAGQTVVFGLGAACNLIPSWAFWVPQMFRPGRNEDDYILWGHSLHQCIGKEFCIVFGTSLFKTIAKLKNVKPAGEGLRKVNLGVPENYFLSEDEGELLFDPMTFKLEYDP